MHQEYIIQPNEEKYVNTHVRPANQGLRKIDLRHCSRVARVAFRAEMASVLELAVCVSWVEMQLLLYVSSISVDSLWCHFAK